MKRIMGLDVGFKRIGVALTDPLKISASPFKVIHRKSNAETFSEIEKIVREKEVERIIVGIPINRRGEKTKMAEKIERFTEKLKNFLEEKNLKVKIEFWDESYSTLEAKEIAGKRKFVDDVSAAVILKEWLNENA